MKISDFSNNPDKTVGMTVKSITDPNMFGTVVCENKGEITIHWNNRGESNVFVFECDCKIVNIFNDN
jgi:hypothetical protein